MNPRALRRCLLWSFVGCLLLTALLAILVLLGSEFGELHGRVLASSAAVSAASVCAMACAAFRERGRLPALGTAGIALAGIALLAVLLLIWQTHGQTAEKVTILLAIYAAATAHAELLMLPPLARRHAFVQPTALIAIGVLTLLLTVVVLVHDPGRGVGRATGVAAVVVALLTLVIPILWRLGGVTAAAAAGGATRTMTLTRLDDGSWQAADGRRYSVRGLDDG